MPTFASTTTSGYSDPIKAYSIKALEERLKAQQAQMAQQQPDAAMMGTIPGGIGHVLGVVGDKMERGRNEQALAAQKQELAKAMSGYDVAGDAPPPAAIAQFDPAMYKDMVQTWAENRRAKMTDATQRYQSDQSSGATKYSADQSSGATRYSADQTSGASRYSTDKSAETAAAEQGNRAAIATAEIEGRRENAKVTADAAVAAAMADPVKEKARLDLQKSLTQRQLMTDKLERANVALNHPEGIYPGAWGRVQAEGTSWLNGLGVGDKEKAERTILIDDAMNEVMTGKMADVLTGPTTNFELEEFRKMGNNPKVSEEERRTQFMKVLAAMKKDRDATATSVRRTGGDTTDPTAAPAAPAAPAGGGNVTAVPDEAAAMALTPGTRFKLPDGRTGTAR